MNPRFLMLPPGRAVSVVALVFLCGTGLGEEEPLPGPGFADGIDDWPREIVVESGDLEVRFESRSFWTLYRIDYKKTRLCLDQWGSHYGSVVSFPGVGFIGSGHTENENEQILDVRLFVDGKPVSQPKSTVRCREFRLEKKSRIRDFVLHTAIAVRDNRILEEVKLRADKPTPVNLIYHFMHPWTPTATEYLAELLDGSRVEGVFNGDRAQKIDGATRWSAVYDGPSGMGAVTYVLDAPSDDDWRTRYWDVPDRYRKHYLTTFLGKTVPGDREFLYRVVTVPVEASAPRWKDAAARIPAEHWHAMLRKAGLSRIIDTCSSAAGGCFDLAGSDQASEAARAGDERSATNYWHKTTWMGGRVV
ncbi:MAG: hypothetical protein ACYTG0_06725 [Planctomycetota bacterium]